ncbi:MAG TPA: MFS transporter [Xanthobacteraceae bacterium]|nr:MFS transporter [Xanthobacteraceae bacterium]
MTKTPPPADPAQAPSAQTDSLRPIVLLSLAGFCSQSLVRVTDSLLPQIASDLAVSIGAASIVVTLYAVMHGTMQLTIGPVADRFGKLRTVVAAAGLTAITVSLCGFAASLPQLALFRMASGATAGMLIPLGLSYIGDAIPYERRQTVLGRYLFGTISGQLFGQAAGGVLGDLMGWRNVFFMLGGLFAIVALTVLWEVRNQPRPVPAPGVRGRSFFADYGIVFADPWARALIFTVFCEGAFAFGALTYISVDLHQRFALSFTTIGLVVACFAIGGILYSLTVSLLVRRLGQSGLCIAGGVLFFLAYGLLAVQPVWWTAPLATAGIGLGFYMFHNTLQTNATQMVPQARATAVALFAAALYIGQTAGVATAAFIVDAYSARPVFGAAAIALLVLTLWFARGLRRHSRSLATPSV